jgi:hypothetical protein
VYFKIKLPVYLFFYMALGLDDFDGGKSIPRAIGRGWALKIYKQEVHINSYFRCFQEEKKPAEEAKKVETKKAAADSSESEEDEEESSEDEEEDDSEEESEEEDESEEEEEEDIAEAEKKRRRALERIAKVTKQTDRKE